MINVFGGKKAKYLSRFLTDENSWVISICSDERLPNNLISLLFNSDTVAPHNVYILGDFVNTEKENWKASILLLNLLENRFDNGKININWFDGDFVKIGEEPREIHSDIVSCAGSYESFISLYSIDESQLDFVSIEEGFDESDRCVSVKFYIKEPFVYDLLPSRLKEYLHQKIYYYLELESLKVLVIPFCGIKEITVPVQLDHLDVRGNENIEIFFDKSGCFLRHLNISACSINKVSDDILSLPFLTTFLAYKNNINHIDFSKFKCIKRISLYRNCINRLELDFFSLPDLLELNVGANPIYKICKINESNKNPDFNLLSLKSFI